jgi:hypothetical protein
MRDYEAQQRYVSEKEAFGKSFNGCEAKVIRILRPQKAFKITKLLIKNNPSKASKTEHYSPVRVDAEYPAHCAASAQFDRSAPM